MVFPLGVAQASISEPGLRSGIKAARKRTKSDAARTVIRSPETSILILAATGYLETSEPGSS